jgi:hypothetical protein
MGNYVPQTGQVGGGFMNNNMMMPPRIGGGLVNGSSIYGTQGGNYGY